MANLNDLEEARELAAHLSGTLDLLANLHASIAVYDNESKPLASTFAMLHERADRLKRILHED